VVSIEVVMMVWSKFWNEGRKPALKLALVLGLI
jgi:hypothetical protein